MFGMDAYGKAKSAIVNGKENELKKLINVDYKDEKHIEEINESIILSLINWSLLDINIKDNSNETALSLVLSYILKHNDLVKAIILREDFKVSTLLESKKFTDIIPTFFLIMQTLNLDENKRKVLISEFISHAIENNKFLELKAILELEGVEKYISPEVYGRFNKISGTNSTYNNILISIANIEFKNDTELDLSEVSKQREQKVAYRDLVKLVIKTFSKININHNITSKDQTITSALKSSIISDNDDLTILLIESGGNLDLDLQYGETRQSLFEVVVDESNIKEGKIPVVNAMINSNQFSYQTKYGNKSALRVLYEADKGEYFLPTLFARNKNEKFIPPADLDEVIIDCLETIKNSKDRNQQADRLKKLNILLEHTIEMRSDLSRIYDKKEASVNDLKLSKLYNLSQDSTEISNDARQALYHLITSKVVNPYANIIIDQISGLRLLIGQQTISLFDIVLKDNPALLRNLILNNNFNLGEFEQPELINNILHSLVSTDLGKNQDALLKFIQDANFDIKLLLTLENEKLHKILENLKGSISFDQFRVLVETATIDHNIDQTELLSKYIKANFSNKHQELLNSESVKLFINEYSKQDLSFPVFLLDLIDKKAINTQNTENEKVKDGSGKTPYQLAVDFSVDKEYQGKKDDFNKIANLLRQKGANINVVVKAEQISTGIFYKELLNNKQFNPLTVTNLGKSPLYITTRVASFATALPKYLALDAESAHINVDDYNFIISVCIKTIKENRSNPQKVEDELHRLKILLAHFRKMEERFNASNTQNIIKDMEYIEILLNESNNKGHNKKLAKEVINSLLSTKRVDPYTEIMIPSSGLIPSKVPAYIYAIFMKDNDVDNVKNLLSYQYFKINPDKLNIANLAYLLNAISTEVFKESIQCVMNRKDKPLDFFRN
ncbi:hypothetical protein RFI_38729 [Reticulomyxa filosa]|uniref:Uncharacterized protein n=1 Tax=Reticulomyxa filosa TaxID=46433 RepID=X6LC94_RETFI|nr:hypothetical protein RFI_38729 [Reticulomyxa filosa]|eukprot:ETN98756.1 hypothetical protein RFI_38729 [Reticulomyxa filosa]